MYRAAEVETVVFDIQDVGSRFYTAATPPRTISWLAAAAETSEKTGNRFGETLGLAGHPQLRLAIAAETGGPAPRERVGADIGPDDTLDDVVAKVAFADVRAVEETAQQLAAPGRRRPRTDDGRP